MRVTAFLLLSAAWSASDTAACPMSARMRAFPPDDLKRYGCMCPWAGSGVRSRCCFCENAGSHPPPDGRYHHYKIGVRINRFKRTSHGLIEKFLTVVRITLNEG